jgi:hypothetical protein
MEYGREPAICTVSAEAKVVALMVPSSKIKPESKSPKLFLSPVFI